MELQLNRPEQRNALTDAMIDTLHETVVQAQENAEISALVIRGNGGYFCAGADLGAMANPTNPDLDALKEIAQEKSQAFAAMCTALSNCPLPIITVVEGHAVGGGLGLACISDICIAGTNSKFGLSAMRIGAMPGPIIPFVVERIGYSQTKLLAVTGNAVDAQKALQMGIVHEVADDVDMSLDNYLRAINSCGPEAVRHTKQMVMDTRTKSRDALVADACKLFGEVITSREGQEGLRAFAEKRKPHWIK